MFDNSSTRKEHIIMFGKFYNFIKLFSNKVKLNVMIDFRCSRLSVVYYEIKNQLKIEVKSRETVPNWGIITYTLFATKTI